MLLSAKEIINKTLELFKRDFHIWSFYILIDFVTALFGFYFVFNPNILLFFGTLGVPSMFVLFLNMLLLLLITVFNIWLHLALIRAIHTRLFNQAVLSIKDQFIKTRPLLAKAVGVSLVVGIIVLLPLILSIVGLSFTGFETLVLKNLKSGGILYFFFGLLGIYGIFHLIYFSVKYVFSYYVVAVDGKKVTESLHEGNKLVSGRMGQIFWRLFAPIVFFSLVYILVNYILTTVAKLIAINFAFSFASIVSLAVSAAVALLSIIATVILYEDAKAKPMLLEVKKD